MKRVPDLPTEQILILDPSGNQVARLGIEPSARLWIESFFSSDYNIIITGGGFYQFCRNGKSGRIWTCKGEGRELRIEERSLRRFFISDTAGEIADFSKAWYASDYKVRVSNDADLKLVICIIISLNESENPGSTAPM